MDHQRSLRAFDALGLAPKISRRALLQGVVATGVGAATATLTWQPGPGAAATTQTTDWQPFDAAVQDAMQIFDIVGAAIAVISADGILHRRTFGVRDLDSGAPVTPDTLFRVASTTKSMTSFMVATFVDDGTLTWDQPVIEAWPDFRAPTDELTKTLRVRNLLGMDTGLSEPVSTAVHWAYPTVLELLHSIAFLPVLGPPHTTYYYNNTVSAAAGYLPLLLQGTAPAALQRAYGRLMQERVYGPAGMATARIADDPRPFSDDYATGYAFDFVQGMAAEPWVAVGSMAPAAGTLASLTDMAAYLRTQLRRGLAPSGRRVVSSSNLAETWKPHIDLPLSPALDPDTVSIGYAMGWHTTTYRDGRHLTWHNAGVDGFTTFIGFFPDDDLGLAVLTNVRSSGGIGGDAFYTYVLNLLLSGRFNLNQGVNDAVVAQFQDARQELQDAAAQAGPVAPAAIASYLGYYEHGYQLAFDASGVLRLWQGARATRLLAMVDGSYVLAGGVLAGAAVHFSRDGIGMQQMEIEGIETVRWSSGPA
jgi:CubicO group peptidase (beta-lactamase class C family)